MNGSRSGEAGVETRRSTCKVGQGRLELPTSRLSGVRSNHLSYWPGCAPSQLGTGLSVALCAADEAGARSLETGLYALSRTALTWD